MAKAFTRKMTPTSTRQSVYRGSAPASKPSAGDRLAWAIDDPTSPDGTLSGMYTVGSYLTLHETIKRAAAERGLPYRAWDFSIVYNETTGEYLLG